MEECKELVRRYEEGEISLYAQIGQKDISMCYVEVATQSFVNEQTAGQEQLSPIQKLEKQDKRNKEIAREKTVDDTKKRIFEVDLTDTKFGADEDKMIYFFLLSSLRKEHFATVGIENEDIRYLTDENKLNIIANLTPKAKAVIRRDYLIANFKSNAYGNNAVADLLLEFAQKPCPKHWQKSRVRMTKCTKSATSVSRKRKLSCRYRNRQSRRQNILKVILPNNSLSLKRLLPDHNS